MILGKNRQFSLLFYGQVTSTIGNNLFDISLLWYVISITHSKIDLTILGFFQTLPGFLGLFAGVLVDRWLKRRTMLISDIVRALLALVLYLLSDSKHPSFILIVVLVFMLKTVGTVFSPAQSAFLPEVVSKDELPSAIGFNKSGNALARLTGMFGGGILISLLGAPLLFVVNAFSFVVSVVTLGFMNVKENKPEHTKRSSMFKEWIAGFKTISRSTTILRNMLIAIISNFALAPFNIVLTAWVNGPLHSTALTFGTLMGCMLAGVFFGGLSLGFVFKHLTYRQLLVYGSIIQGGFIILLGCSKSITLDMFFMLIQGLALGILNGTLPAINLRVIPKDMRGRIFGTLGAGDTLTQPLGVALFGFLMVHIHLSLLFVIIGAIVIISGMIFVLPSKQESLDLGTSSANA